MGWSQQGPLSRCCCVIAHWKWKLCCLVLASTSGSSRSALAAWSWADVHCQPQEAKPRPLTMNCPTSQGTDGQSCVQARDIRQQQLHTHLAEMTYHNLDLNERGFTEPLWVFCVSCMQDFIDVYSKVVRKTDWPENIRLLLNHTEKSMLGFLRRKKWTCSLLHDVKIWLKMLLSMLQLKWMRGSLLHGAYLTVAHLAKYIQNCEPKFWES